MGRFRDAWKTLRGRQDVQIRQHALLAQIAAEWASIASEIYNVMENLNRLDARLKKREQRAEQAKPTHVDPAPSPGSVKPWKSHKEALRARLRGGAIPGVPPPSDTPSDGEFGEREAS